MMLTEANTLSGLFERAGWPLAGSEWSVCCTEEGERGGQHRALFPAAVQGGCATRYCSFISTTPDGSH